MNKRTWKKKRKQSEILQTEALITEVNKATGTINDISRQMYEEIRGIKKNQDKKYLLQIIRLREEKKNDIAKLKSKNKKVHEEIQEDVCELEKNSHLHQKAFKYMEKFLEEQRKLIRYLKMDVNQFTDILEDNDVDIIDGREFDTFDANLMKPLKRVDTDCMEKHNKVAAVYTSAYEWKGIVIKKMDVEVYIYNG